MPLNSTPDKPSNREADVAERLRTVVGRLGRSLRLTHVDGELSPSQREVLATITRRGTLRLSELAADEGLNPTMLSRIVAKLEAANLATRTPDEADARVVILAATDAGRVLCEQIRTERTDALLFALSHLSPEQLNALADAMPVLESLVDTLKRRDR
jgi:DNA-binding MarR family transcriptional regulator